MKIVGSTKVFLYKDNRLIMQDQFMNIIGYLFNRKLIELPDEYWIEEDNGWKSYYRKNYSKIFNNFNKLTKEDYEIRIKDER